MVLSDTARLILAALAVYRLAQLVAIDDGPLDACRRLRAWCGTLGNDRARSFLGGLVHCPYCVGLYAAAAMGLLVLVPTSVGDVVLLVLGLAGAQAWLQGPREANDGDIDAAA